jgi:hypothetical protein
MVPMPTQPIATAFPTDAALSWDRECPMTSPDSTLNIGIELQFGIEVNEKAKVSDPEPIEGEFGVIVTTVMRCNLCKRK